MESNCGNVRFLDKHQHLQRKKTLIFLIISFLALTMFINCVSIKWALCFQNLFTYGKVITLLILMVVGLVAVGSGKNNFASFASYISMHIFHTVLYTFCEVLTRRIY